MKVPFNVKFKPLRQVLTEFDANDFLTTDYCKVGRAEAFMKIALKLSPPGQNDEEALVKLVSEEHQLSARGMIRGLGAVLSPMAALLGGVCTLIGTSTNLVVAGLLQEEYPDDPEVQNLSLFGITRYGVPVAFMGIAYVILATPWLLARGSGEKLNLSATSMMDEAEDLLLGARLTQWSPAAERTVQRSGLRDTGGIYLVRVWRRETGNVHHAVGPEFVSIKQQTWFAFYNFVIFLLYSIKS